MATITVTHIGGSAFEIGTRGHTTYVDQPRPGGVEVGPSPTELFVAGIAACAGYYAEEFLRRHGLPHQGVRVECDWLQRAAEPVRVSRVRLRVVTPEELPEAWRAPLLAAVDNCTVRNSLRQPPDVAVSLATAPPGHAATDLIATELVTELTSAEPRGPA